MEVKRDYHGRLLPGSAALPGAGRPPALRLPKAAIHLALLEFNPIDKLIECYNDLTAMDTRLGPPDGENMDTKLKIKVEKAKIASDLQRYIEGHKKESVDPEQPSTPEQSLERAKLAQDLMNKLNEELKVPVKV